MPLEGLSVAVAQVDPTVGDVEGNARLAVEVIGRAAGADLVLFPEMAIPGYPPRDLLLRPSFVEACEAALGAVAEATASGPAAVVGTVRREGGRLYNTAAVCERGRVVAFRDKRHLPAYDVFDEERYFTPSRRWRPVRVAGARALVTVCEDLWVEDSARDRAARGCDLVLNLSASPFHAGKVAEREGAARRVARACGRPLAYANLVGGQDDLVFDGGSFALDGRGRVVARAPRFAEALLRVEGGRGEVAQVREGPAELADAICLGLGDYAHKNGFRSVVIGLSGGIDSSLVAALAVRALGAGAVVGVTMPSAVSSKGSVEDSRALAANLGIAFHVVPIAALVDAYARALAPLFEGTEPGVAEENVQARVRGNLLMALSNRFGHLVLACGNKSELAVGYSTLYGDLAGGLAPIADLPKTQVYEVARFLNREAGRELIPRAVLEKPPSAELRPGQRDTDSLPPYDVLDPILALLVEGHTSVEDIVAKGFDEATVRDVARRVDAAEHKRRQAPPGIKVTTRAFGTGRRMPITSGFRG